MKDTALYDTLGVSPTASDDEIKKTWRKLARKLHPDVHPDDEVAAERFKDASAAYEVLSDPEKRKLYDEFGEASTRVGFNPAQARAWQRQAGFGGGRGGFGGDRGGFGGGPGYGGFGRGGDMEDIMAELLGRRPRGPRRGRDIRANLTIDFRSAALGDEQVLILDGGRRMKVRIPPGMADGETIRLRGQGSPGERSGPAGDLLIQLSIGPHPVFRREGDDLHVSLPITVDEAVLGGRVTVPTLDGKVKMSIPAGTQSGQRLRLGGKGIARRGRPPGDLIIEVAVAVPTLADLDADQRGALQAALQVVSEAYAEPPREALLREAHAT